MLAQGFHKNNQNINFQNTNIPSMWMMVETHLPGDTAAVSRVALLTNHGSACGNLKKGQHHFQHSDHCDKKRKKRKVELIACSCGSIMHSPQRGFRYVVVRGKRLRFGINECESTTAAVLLLSWSLCSTNETLHKH